MHTFGMGTKNVHTKCFFEQKDYKLWRYSCGVTP